MSRIDPNEPCWYGSDEETEENQWDYEFDPRDSD